MTGLPSVPISATALSLAALEGITSVDPIKTEAKVLDPEAEKKRKEELKAAREKRAKELKRGPGVAALVQGALKRAQEAPSMGKKDELVEKAQRQREEAEAAARKEQERLEHEREQERMEALRRKQEEQKKAEEEKKKRMEEMEARERERADREALERRRQAEQADEEMKKKEAETRDQRVKASMEAAKKQQAERAAAKAAKEAETLYADMPQPDADTAAATEAALKAAGERGPQIDLALPPEERGKVVFLDVDGVLRPARAGTFDISTDGDAAKPDTSDFFPAALKALRYIMERSSPRIVLCSEWRRSETLLKALEEIFYKNRLRLWSDVTSIDFKLEKGSDALRCFAERRAKEISEWLRQHEGEISGWAVLDDINLSMTDEAKRAGKPMGPHHVQTWPLCGLTTGNAKTAVRILNGALINKVVVERPVAGQGGIAG